MNKQPAANEHGPPTHDVVPTSSNVGSLLDGFCVRLERMIAVRLDRRLATRFDPADILQETFLEVVQRLGEFRPAGAMSFFLWVRLLAMQKLFEFHRRHLGAERRDVRREVPLEGFRAASSVLLAPAFHDPTTPPSKVAQRKEAVLRLQIALDELDEVDRETLVLRYFERLSNEEAANVLGLTCSGAKKRHLRALNRLKGRLGDLRDAIDGPWNTRT